MNKEQALYNFWSEFGVAAYDEQSVPTGENAPEPPYITYTTSNDSIGSPVLLNASVWYRSTSWGEISLKVDEISKAIGYGGLLLDIDDGYVYLYRGTPFAQRMADPTDDSIRRYYLNLTAEYLTAD